MVRRLQIDSNIARACSIIAVMVKRLNHPPPDPRVYWTLHVGFHPRNWTVGWIELTDSAARKLAALIGKSCFPFGGVAQFCSTRVFDRARDFLNLGVNQRGIEV